MTKQQYNKYKKGKSGKLISQFLEVQWSCSSLDLTQQQRFLSPREDGIPLLFVLKRRKKAEGKALFAQKAYLLKQYTYMYQVQYYLKCQEN